MKNQKFDINKLRVASPCSAGWDTMTGNDRVRHCHSCKLNIYNFSEMTGGEVQNLIENTEGRICGRLFLRADGTVITKDCPVGFRAFYKRTARFAGAALTAAAALFSFGFGQSQSKKASNCKTAGKIFRTESRNLNLVEGTVTDSNCAVIPGAKITLINKDTNRESQVESDENGYYRVLLVAPGRYTYNVEANGFETYEKNLDINTSESLRINTMLEVGGFIGIIDIRDDESIIDLKSSSNTFRIMREMITRNDK